jgi:hypothetical protein
MAISIIEDRELWDRTVDGSPYGLLFHKWDFLKTVEKHTGWKLLPYAVYKGELLLSLFPLFYKKDIILKSVFSPPPGSCIPYLGPTMSAIYNEVKLSTRESHLQTVVDEVSAEIRKLSPSFVYVQMPPAFRDIRPFKWNGYEEHSNFTYFIALDRPVEEIRNGFDQTLRRTIKKLDGMKLELRQVTDTEAFCNIVSRRYAEQGLTSPIPGPGYLKDLLMAYPDNVRMYSLYHEEEVVSSIVISLYKGRMTLWMGNARPGGSGGINGANDYMLWSLLRKAKEEGCTEYEIQGGGDRRLWQYKSKYNPRLEISYAATRKDELGRAAEWAYVNLKRRKWHA